MPRRAFWQNFCVNLSIQTQYIRESFIFVRVLRRRFAYFWWAHAQIFSLLAWARVLWLLCLNWQSLHEFSLNTDIKVCCSGLACERALSAPGWWWNKCSYSSIRHSIWTRENDLSTFFFFFFFIHRCYCNVLGSQNAHPLTETYISRTLFVLRVIYNKPYYRCVVRFKLNRGPSACRTVWRTVRFEFFPRTVPPLSATHWRLEEMVNYTLKAGGDGQLHTEGWRRWSATHWRLEEMVGFTRHHSVSLTECNLCAQKKTDCCGINSGFLIVFQWS